MEKYTVSEIKTMLGTGYAVNDQYGNPIAKCSEKASAELIVKAVNNHDKLVEALSKAKVAIEELHIERYKSLPTKVPYPLYIRKQPILQEINTLLKHLESNPLKN